ncbi:DUF134 domain-containing protein [Vibrio cincinnatiensis]|jgi:predicted DNA-binding protein (UPF0251 family)|uniref:UPF0251 protein SAMN02745782_01435 n=1 Tax=Vibrio cincinnatiensis DSM 19608 TaxID=1123491 RepID=A0A1T4NS58_VIBCI|nr:DUF134 domain-containing protein [Vibrio cincinnatiensis]MCG3720938.1 DUF134 domain-containing protein [Vibrio cincinnatiensis]MCG3724872.1 DUF134 domain-containing protein [Vibrio cincinnatiensis]MCG3732844.1 DUF134 domain-containing protein [Vibrio cincinnatiensis]MCG3735654.1 DUF134 domain-containing protein [Vibrio cincinnatiensis]MCG3739069.1 DUF134 domain-containing protein [Vibrio cincinnatiensis]
MARPKIPRQICGFPAQSCFKPNGIPMAQLEAVSIQADEFEALRLVDYQGMQQQEAAIVMGISRQTLANLVKSARRKVSDCLLHGKALLMEERPQ